LVAGATVNASLETKVRTRLVLHWAEIAIEQASRAREGRAEVLRAYEEQGSPVPLGAELHPAMIVIAACAHSLDGLYAELAELVGPETLAKWEEARKGGRWREVAAILELSVERDVDPWRPRMKALFEDRNRVVHPKAKDKAPEKHPVLDVNVAPEYTIYTVEAAEESLELLLEILSACVDAPKPSIEAWANDTRPAVETLRLKR
jgi:hypothetical protein